MSSLNNPAEPAVVERIKKKSLYKRGKDALKRATTSRSPKEEPRTKDPSRFSTLLRKGSFSSVQSTPPTTAPSTPQKADGNENNTVKDTSTKAASKHAPPQTDLFAHNESPFATPRSDIAVSTPKGSPAAEQSMSPPSTPPSPERRSKAPSSTPVKTHSQPSVSLEAQDEPPDAPSTLSADLQFIDEQDNRRVSPFTTLSTDQIPDLDHEYQAGHESVPADDYEEIQSIANGDQGVNLATLKDDMPGGGTALPFGEQSGSLEGYTTLPDPQGHFDSNHVYSNISDQDGSNSLKKQGGKPARVVLAVLLAAAAGAAGIYISSHPAISSESRKKSRAERPHGQINHIAEV